MNPLQCHTYRMKNPILFGYQVHSEIRIVEGLPNLSQAINSIKTWNIQLHDANEEHDFLDQDQVDLQGSQKW